MYGFSAAADGGFGTAQVVVSVVAGGLLAGYVLHALRGKGTALIDPRLFARRGFAAATSTSFLLGASLYSSMLLLPLHYQQVEHASALRAGLLLAPQALGTASSRRHQRRQPGGRLGRHGGARRHSARSTRRRRQPAAAFGTTFWWALGISLITFIPAAPYPSK